MFKSVSLTMVFIHKEHKSYEIAELRMLKMPSWMNPLVHINSEVFTDVLLDISFLCIAKQNSSQKTKVHVFLKIPVKDKLRLYSIASTWQTNQRWSNCMKYFAWFWDSLLQFLIVNKKKTKIIIQKPAEWIHIIIKVFRLPEQGFLRMPI